MRSIDVSRPRFNHGKTGCRVQSVGPHKYPSGGDVHGAERAEVEALRATAAMGDEIDVEEPGAGVVPLGERPDGDLVAEPSPDTGRGRAPWRPARPRRGEQAAEGG